MSELEPIPETGYFSIPNIDRYHRVRNNLERIMNFLGMKVEGYEHLESVYDNEDKNGVIIASTHDSWVDIVALGAANNIQPMRFLGKQEVWRYPYVGQLAVDAGAYSVDRSQSSSRKSSLSTTVDMLNNGETTTIYLEGTRNRSKDRRSLGRPKTGVARASLLSIGTTAILPVAIGYRSNVLRQRNPIGSAVVFGEPKYVEQGDDGSVEVHEITDDIEKRLLQLKKRAVDLAESHKKL